MHLSLLVKKHKIAEKMGMPRLVSLVGILRGKKESRKTRLALEFDARFDKNIFFIICITKEKRKIS